MTGNLKISYAFKDRLGMAYEALLICLQNMDDKNTFDWVRVWSELFDVGRVGGLGRLSV